MSRAKWGLVIAMAYWGSIAFSALLCASLLTWAPAQWPFASLFGGWSAVGALAWYAPYGRTLGDGWASAIHDALKDDDE